MKISTKIIIIIALSIVAITSGCNEEFGSDNIKDGNDKPALNYLYTFNYYTGNPTDWLYFGSHYLIESSTNGPVTAMEWNTTFSIESSFPLTDVKIESTEPWLTCERLEGATFSLSAATYNTSFESEYDRRTGHVYLTPVNRTGGDNHDYKIDVEVTQNGRDLILYADGKWLSSSEQTISFSENGGTSKTYEVRADGEYTITKGANDSWYTITHYKDYKGTNHFFVTATENTTSLAREGLVTIALVDLPTGESKEIKIKISQASIPIEDNVCFKYVNELKIDRTYLIVNGSQCATPIDLSNNYGYLKTEAVNILDGHEIVQKNKENAFTFVSSATVGDKTYKLDNGQFMIIDSNGRYINCYETYDSFNMADAPTLTEGKIDSSFIFTATCNNDGLWTITNAGKSKWIQYNTEYSTWGIYNEAKGLLPSLYMLL